MTDHPASSSFAHDLHRALVYLYDPGELARSPLLRLFSLEGHANPGAALQRILTEAIAKLRPLPDTPPQAKAWRTYRLLFHRYTEQSSQVEVSNILGLSERQLRREESEALQTLADYLWAHHGVGLRAAATQVPEATAQDQAGTSGRDAELEWLHKSFTGETADPAQAVQAALKIVGPLLDSLHVRSEIQAPEDLPRVALPPSTLRQVLLNILTPAMRAAAGGQVLIAAQAEGEVVRITVEPRPGKRAPAAPSNDDVESLEMARQLAGLANGTLAVTALTNSFAATLTLPAAERAAVLIIDDNVDALQLFRRCLAGTRFPYIGTRDPEQALELAERVAPRIIVLDLMLPGVDGWEVLGRLREHPRTRSIPIVVCSILPQEQLALALGAAAFLRKPISRATLLEALDQVVGQRTSRFR